MNLRAYYLNSFFMNLNFDFRFLAQKCLKPSVNGVLKFQFFFLSLSSKVLACVGVRTSEYPYMDICGSQGAIIKIIGPAIFKHNMPILKNVCKSSII